MRGKSILITTITVAFLLIFSAFRRQENPAGVSIYQQYCTSCHGQDGTKGRWGAKDLQKSTLPSPDVIRIISDGRKWMPSWKKKLRGEQIAAVAEFVKTLRKAR